MTWAHYAVDCRVVGYCTVFGGAAKHTVWIENVMQKAHMPQRDDNTVILAALGHATSVYNL